MTAQALVDSTSKALRLPRPHLHEPNRAFTLLEDWTTLVRQVATLPIHVRPLGYYRTPDAIDVYVFECSMEPTDGDRKTWKIYRRYSHFQGYVSQSSALLSSMVVPRLSQAYMKLFSAKSCKDRLVELHGWLLGVIENTQTYCHQQELFTSAEVADFIGAMNESPVAVPAILLGGFLLAGANQPFPHVFRGMPSFALAMEETNVQLTKAPVYPSMLRSSLETTAGLGLRLTASHEQQGKYIGAMVSGFLRDVSEHDKELAQINIGSKLTRINGVDVTDEPFEKVLAHLRNAGLPLRLRFIYNPHMQRRARGRSVHLRTSAGSISSPMAEMRRRGSTMSNYRDSSENLPSLGPTTPKPPLSSSSAASTASMIPSRQTNMTPARGPSGSTSAVDALSAAQKRSYSVDARKSLFGSVFSDFFGRRRGETTDLMFNNQMDEIFSWDDVGGEFEDIITRGFFTYLSQSMLHDLRKRRKTLAGETLLDEDHAVDEKTWKELDQRKGQGIWSTATGPMGLAVGSCKLRDVEAAMLEIPPVFFSSRLGHMGSEKRLIKGFVIVSVNNESTFGMKFSSVMRMLAKASRPTSVCFRWFKDYSPFLETELAEQDPSAESGRRASRHSPGRTFESSLDCLSEAQADLCSNLHLALVENASIRNEIGTLHEANRELRVQHDQMLKLQSDVEAQVQEQKNRIASLLQEVADSQLELNQSKQKLRVAEEKVAVSKQEQQELLERAHANAIQKIAEHQDRLVKESNKSIETAKALAERKMQKQLDSALNEMQRKHNEYLQKLAEEHSEEVESLSQQVAVWRHQVEVLTEAEKRNYASMINQGAYPYHDYQRSRFGYGDSPYSSSGSTKTLRSSERHYATGGASAAAASGAAAAQGFGYNSLAAASAHMRGGNNQQEDEGSPGWRDTASPGGFKDHGSSEFSDRSSASNQPGTIWDRVASLF